MGDAHRSGQPDRRLPGFVSARRAISVSSELRDRDMQGEHLAHHFLAVLGTRRGQSPFPCGRLDGKAILS